MSEKESLTVRARGLEFYWNGFFEDKEWAAQQLQKFLDSCVPLLMVTEISTETLRAVRQDVSEAVRRASGHMDERAHLQTLQEIDQIIINRAKETT